MSKEQNNSRRLEFIMGDTEFYSIVIWGNETPADTEAWARDHNLDSHSKVKVIQLHNKRTDKTIYAAMSAGLVRLLMTETWSLDGDWRSQWDIQYLSYVRNGKARKEVVREDFVQDGFNIWWK